MFNEKFILDTFSATGNSVPEFKSTLQEMEKCTSVETCSTNELTLLSIDPSNKAEKVLNPVKVDEEDQILRCFSLAAGKVWINNYQLQPSYLNIASFLQKAGHYEDLIKETCKSTRLMISKEKTTYFTSRFLIRTMGMRADVGGEFVVEPSLARDIALAHMFGKDKDTTLIFHKIGSIKKLFAMMSGKYTHIPLTSLCDVLENVAKEGLLGEMVCHHWLVDHNISQIYVEFPEKAADLKMIYGLDDDFVPGLYLASSGTGACSWTMRGTWRVGNSISVEAEIKRKHIGEIDIEAIVESAEDEIFKKYTKLPEALCELMTIDITDPAWDLTDPKMQKKNIEAVSETIKSVFKQIGMVDAIGKKQEKELYEGLCEELNPTVAYTAYDVALSIMGIADRIEGLNKAYENPLAKATGRAPYVKYEKSKAAKLALTA